MCVCMHYACIQYHNEKHQYECEDGKKQTNQQVSQF